MPMFHSLQAIAEGYAYLQQRLEEMIAIWIAHEPSISGAPSPEDNGEAVSHDDHKLLIARLQSSFQGPCDQAQHACQDGSTPLGRHVPHEVGSCLQHLPMSMQPAAFQPKQTLSGRATTTAHHGRLLYSQPGAELSL